MKREKTELEIAVEECGIEIQSTHLGLKKDKPVKGESGKAWEYDEFSCTLRYDGRSDTFSYKMGLGHRKNNLPVMPKVADVVWSLLMDLNSVVDYDSFDEFCDNLGYDNDSIQALNTYEACKQEAKKIVELFGHDVADELRSKEH